MLLSVVVNNMITNHTVAYNQTKWPNEYRESSNEGELDSEGAPSISLRSGVMGGGHLLLLGYILHWTDTVIKNQLSNDENYAMQYNIF